MYTFVSVAHVKYIFNSIKDYTNCRLIGKKVQAF